MKVISIVSFVISALLVVEIYCGSDGHHDCSLPPDVGYECAEGMTTHPNIVWYYANLTSGFCEEMVDDLQYLGCGGNSNRFPDITTCETICGPQGDVRPSGV